MIQFVLNMLLDFYETVSGKEPVSVQEITKRRTSSALRAKDIVHMHSCSGVYQV